MVDACGWGSLPLKFKIHILKPFWMCVLLQNIISSVLLAFASRSLWSQVLISVHKWSAAHKVLKSQRCCMGMIYMQYMQSWKQFNNVPPWLSPQWLCGNSCTWTYDVRFRYIHLCMYIYIYIYACIIHI